MFNRRGVLRLASALVVSAILDVNAALAVDIRGFGTGGAVISDSPFYSDSFDSYQNRLNFSKLTRFGLNVHQRLNDEWSVASQFVAKADVKNLTQFLDWGFISWAPNQNFAIRAGRVILPVWLFSQQIDVGYSYPWAQLPIEVYGLNPFKSINGVSVLSKWRFGASVIQAELVGGDGQQNLYSYDPKGAWETQVNIRNVIAADLSYNWDEKFVLRAGYARGNPTITGTGMKDTSALTGSDPTGYQIPVTTVLDATNPVQMMSLGLKTEYENVFLLSEYAKRLVGGAALPLASGYYATLGYRWKKFIPYFTWAGQDVTGTEYYNSELGTAHLGDTSLTLGAGYQVMDSAILKLEGSRYSERYGDETKNYDFNVYRATIDFVF